MLNKLHEVIAPRTGLRATDSAPQHAADVILSSLHQNPAIFGILTEFFYLVAACDTRLSDICSRGTVITGNFPVTWLYRRAAATRHVRQAEEVVSCTPRHPRCPPETMDAPNSLNREWNVAHDVFVALRFSLLQKRTQVRSSAEVTCGR